MDSDKHTDVDKMRLFAAGLAEDGWQNTEWLVSVAARLEELERENQRLREECGMLRDAITTTANTLSFSTAENVQTTAIRMLRAALQPAPAGWEKV